MRALVGSFNIETCRQKYSKYHAFCALVFTKKTISDIWFDEMISMILKMLPVIKVILKKNSIFRATLFPTDRLDIVTPIHIQTMSTTGEKGEHVDENV